MREHAVLDIVDPQTGLNVAKQIYSEAGAAPSDETKNRETPQPQVSYLIIIINHPPFVMYKNMFDEEINYFFSSSMITSMIKKNN